MGFLRRSLIGLLLASLTVAALVMAAWTVRDAIQTRLAQSGGPGPGRERVYSAAVVRVTPETVAPILEAFGEIVSRRTLELRAATSGTIVSLSENFVEGGRVKAGDVLVQVDPTDLADALALAEADTQDARAELANAEAALILERDDLTSARAQASLRQAAVERQQNLVDRGVGTAADLETAALAAASAEQAILAARASVNAADARVASATTALARAEIALTDAKRNLDAATIRADFSGALADVLAVEGRLVTANEQLATLVDPEALDVSFRLSTAQYTRLIDASGALLPANVAAALNVSGVNLIAQGQIVRESAAVGEGQTGRLIFATLTNTAGFRPGDFVTVSVNEPELRGVARLPASAVSSTGTVLVLGENDRLEERPAQVVRRQGDSVLIRAEDLAGAEVVAKRTPTLGAGIRIRPEREEGQEAGAGSSGGGGDGGGDGGGRKMITLEDDRRAKLVEFVEGSARFPAQAKARILNALKQPEVPERMVERIEANMGS